MPKVTVMNSKQEAAGRIREIISTAKRKRVRVKINLSFYDPDVQRYVLMKGNAVTLDTGSVLFVLGLAEKLRVFLGQQEKQA